VESEFTYDFDTDPARFSMTPPEGYEYKEKTFYNSWWRTKCSGSGIRYRDFSIACVKSRAGHAGKRRARTPVSCELVNTMPACTQL